MGENFGEFGEFQLINHSFILPNNPSNILQEVQLYCVSTCYHYNVNLEVLSSCQTETGIT